MSENKLERLYSLILFDCDGTLVDSEGLNNQAVLDTLKDCGVDRYDMNYALANFVGLRFSKILSLVSADTGQSFPEDTRDLYLQNVHRRIVMGIKEITGALDCVKTAAAHAVTCVVSNGERRNVIFSLEKMGFLPYFADTHIFTGLMAPNPKPAPDLFLLAAEKMGIAPSQTLVIEDSIVGVTAGVAAGMEVWGFCGTHHTPEDHAQKLKALGAARVFSSMHDMTAALKTAYI